MRDEVVVTGMAGTFPGAASVDALWEQIVLARVAPRVSLETRWGIPRERYHGAPGVSGRTYCDQAFCIETVAQGGEVRDPQVRLGMRAVRDAIADASSAGAPLDLRETGLVAATSWTAPSYFEADCAAAIAPFGGRTVTRGEAHDPAQQLAALAAPLGGPRIAVDTACASSLYAIDAAMGLLATGRARSVVVLGLSAMLPPFLYVGFAKLMALSPSGRIRPFVRDANGIVPGECAAAVVLELREDARVAGRRVLGVVRSVGIAADGAERSVFAPGAEGQKLAYARAYAGIDPREVDYVEAHGTATALGDETEIETLDGFFGRERPGGRALPIGSVKALVGHTLAAAGMVSLVKVLLMMRARTIPPHIEGEPHARLAGTSLALPGGAAPWGTSEGRPLRAGISCFGFGGANAHLVVESGDERRRTQTTAPATALDELLAIVDLETAQGDPRLGPFEMDGAGLRTGPNFLKRIDPLQLLLTHLTREILERNPAARGWAETGVAVTCNMGGDLSLRLARELALRFQCSPPAGEAAAARAPGPDLTPESIASSLPTMCSGYPAYHFDLRGFHQTFAGEAGAFWTTWGLAPYWLAGKCRALVLGAATRAVGLEAASSAARPEGAYLFLVKTLSAARADGDRVLATVRTISGPGEPTGVDRAARSADAPSLREACDAAGVDMDRAVGVDLREAPLAEAAGVDALARAVVGEGGVIALRDREGVRLVLVVTKEAEPDARPRKMGMPLTVSFPDREMAAPPAETGTTDVTRLLDTNASALGSFFAAQRAALRLLASHAADVGAPSRRPENVVLARTMRDGGRYVAELVVDETHPYFFDHPLDHVPGILLGEGIAQLAEIAGADAVRGERYVSRLELRFRRFCEKSEPVRLELAAKGTSRGAFGGRIVQRGRELALFDVEIGSARGAAPAHRVPQAAPAERTRDARLLHKRRAENVLVGPLTKDGDAHVCVLHAPPAGHFFEDGSPRFFSALYLIEGARQALMLGAHGVLGIPLGRPMNLLSLSLAAEEPVPRGLPLTLRFSAGKERRMDRMTLADVRIAIRAGERELGAVRIRAQVVDAETYQEQRKVKS